PGAHHPDRRAGRRPLARRGPADRADRDRTGPRAVGRLGPDRHPSAAGEPDQCAQARAEQHGAGDRRAQRPGGRADRLEQGHRRWAPADRKPAGPDRSARARRTRLGNLPRRRRGRPVRGACEDSAMSAESSASPIRVLVCDDQDLVRTGFATIIDSEPDLAVAGEAADGERAVQLARRERPDVVVMDIRMPRLDGIEATRRIAGRGVPNPAKVLIVTTFNLDSLVFDALRAGASGFLLKDARPAAFLDAIRTVAAGESLLAPAVTRTLIGRYAERLRPTGADDERLASLTAREHEVLSLVAEGLSNAEIAAALVISHETVKTYVSRILTKLDLRDRVQAVVLAHRVGLAGRI